uniref:Four helix bundle protein n=1 Tax=Caenorhabditis tropicalis TaxID=1561998 RepID=A0A1I7T5Q8_9PELO
MNVLQQFVDKTFEMTTGLGEMKVAEAIFLGSVDCASQTIAHSNRKDDSILLRKVMSLAYKGQNIIKMCVHLPRDSNAEKYAHELNKVAHEIDVLVCSIENDQSGDH